MKNIIMLALLGLASFTFGQVAIGKASISVIPSTTTTNPSISLEFGDYVANQGKGIVLPWVTSAAATTGSVTGTLILDVNDKIVKYRNSPTTWFNLSKNETTVVDGTTNFDTTGSVNNGLQTSITDAPDAKVGIGTVNSSIPGILVLEDTNKAMVLPKVPSPHTSIINPEPGTLAYDTVTKQLAVYNGTVWSFWKP
ncbi:MAG: hypothetical protein K0R36_919 [Chryseobacterium sp.]|jgi:hypothetical protein|nr:hypothetical protein [Chryseobacterium sp.]